MSVSRFPSRLPELRTPRLRLRALCDDDIDELFAIYGDEEVMRYASDPAFPDRDTVRAMLASVADLFAKRASLEWGIEDAATSRVIGTCGLHAFDWESETAEVGCLLMRARWGQGFMREALAAVCAYAAGEQGFRLLRARIDAPNARSRRLFERLGFVRGDGESFERVLM